MSICTAKGRVLAAIALTLTFLQVSAEAGMIVNGGFETGDLTGWSDDYSAGPPHVEEYLSASEGTHCVFMDALLKRWRFLPGPHQVKATTPKCFIKCFQERPGKV